MKVGIFHSGECEPNPAMTALDAHAKSQGVWVGENECRATREAAQGARRSTSDTTRHGRTVHPRGVSQTKASIFDAKRSLGQVRTHKKKISPKLPEDRHLRTPPLTHLNLAGRSPRFSSPSRCVRWLPAHTVPNGRASTPRATSIPVLCPEMDSRGLSSEVAPARTNRVSVNAGMRASGKKYTWGGVPFCGRHRSCLLVRREGEGCSAFAPGGQLAVHTDKLFMTEQHPLRPAQALPTFLRFSLMFCRLEGRLRVSARLPSML